MERSREEIAKALQVIKDVCSSNNVCFTCPFAGVTDTNHIRCNLEVEPENWKINDVNNELWRAFE